VVTEEKVGETIVWRRIDIPGHEVATIVPAGDGWRVDGVAILVESGRPCRIDYEIRCDARWMTQRCVIRGHVAERPVRLDVERSATGVWSIDGVEVPALEGCDDIDLGFSPSTNLLPIRRLALSIGAHAVVRAAWIRFPELTAEVLVQGYTRTGAHRYVYESAGGAFRRELDVDTFGNVVDYPGLWRAEATAPFPMELVRWR
jgi:uncharacterized protein